MLHRVCLALIVLSSAVLAAEEPLPTLSEKTSDLQPARGFMNLWSDAETGRLFLEVPAPDAGGRSLSMLFVEGLTAGLGSNPVGLDRGQIGGAVVLDVRRVDRRVVFEQPNLAFRAESDDPDERAAVRESFARSVHWVAPLVALEPDGRGLVDLTPFLVKDHHRVVDRLRQAGEGTFRLDGDRSFVEPGGLLVFPDNVEVDVRVTYAGDQPGREVRTVTPTPAAVTLTQHLSFVRLPDDGYRPRPFDPRAGSFSIAFRDYATAIEAPLMRRWIVRHRLQRATPGDPDSPIVAPIVYHVDRGAPEPIRGALLDGARWWEEAFAAAGFPGGFRVELLPEGAHPLDVRYNVIEWVHRATRGWSYGGGVVDPRTGERVKGHVSLGSLRVRQDRRIFEGLLGVPEPVAADSGDTADTADTADAADAETPDAAAARDGASVADAEDAAGEPPMTPTRLALARIRQLAAHEVGHTLGLMHNFAASTNGRASVMDYPAPWIRVAADGSLDASNAYDVGIGAWDVFAIRHAYTELTPDADEAAALEAIVQERIAAGLRFLTDADARPAGSAHPLAALWDNGADPVAELAHVLAVRRVALAGFGERNLAPGRPLAELEETLAPIYFYHRYQLTAAARSLGGVDYRYALRGDGQTASVPVSPDRQRAALTQLLQALDPRELDLPDALLARLVPRPADQPRNRELFRGRTSPMFDPLAAARTAADLVFDELLQPQRSARLIDAARRRPSTVSFDEVLATLTRAVFESPVGEPRRWQVLRDVLRARLVDRMIALASDVTATDEVRLRTEASLGQLQQRLSSGLSPIEIGLGARVRRFVERDRESDAPTAADPPPPGSPIGTPAAFLTGCSLG